MCIEPLRGYKESAKAEEDEYFDPSDDAWKLPNMKTSEPRPRPYYGNSAFVCNMAQCAQQDESDEADSMFRKALDELER